jgi:hypothetical protein
MYGISLSSLSLSLPPSLSLSLSLYSFSHSFPLYPLFTPIHFKKINLIILPLSLLSTYHPTHSPFSQQTQEAAHKEVHTPAVVEVAVEAEIETEIDTAAAGTDTETGTGTDMQTETETETEIGTRTLGDDEGPEADLHLLTKDDIDESENEEVSFPIRRDLSSNVYIYTSR